MHFIFLLVIDSSLAQLLSWLKGKGRRASTVLWLQARNKATSKAPTTSTHLLLVCLASLASLLQGGGDQASDAALTVVYCWKRKLIIWMQQMLMDELLHLQSFDGSQD